MNGLCENADKCGGCRYQGIGYEEELRTKEEGVLSLFSPVIRDDYIYDGIIPSPKALHYRNKMEYTFGDMQKDGPLTLGLHQRRSFFNILNADCCLLPHPDFGFILERTRDYFAALGISYFHKKSHRGYLRHLLVRRAERTGEILADLVTTGEDPGLGGTEESLLEGWKEALLGLCGQGKLEGHFAGILHTRNDALSDAIKDEGTETLYGADFFFEEILGLRFRITPFSFFQTNSLGAELLYGKVREYASWEVDPVHSGRLQVIYDLYSGTGTITELMAARASQAVGIELVPEAVKAARENTALNGIRNCSFIAGDVLKIIGEGGRLIREDGSLSDVPKPDVIILDPPRDGVHSKALRKIIDYGVSRMVYVACKPSSLARDLVPLQEAGYRVIRMCAVDMFPKTDNIEMVCLLSKLS